MDNRTVVITYARVAGFAYLATILLGILSANLISAKLVVPDDSVATIGNIMVNGLLFRIGLASEVVMYTLVILLAHALYIVLREVNQNLALLALLWRLAEAIVGIALTVVSGTLPLLLLKAGEPLGPNQLHALVYALLNIRAVGLDVVLILIGLGGTLFCYLFWTSRIIPRILAAWGIFTYLTMLFLSLTSLLIPIAESTKMMFYTPGGLFEIILGLWLLFKGTTAVR